jgi:hypothetical protein
MPLFPGRILVAKSPSPCVGVIPVWRRGSQGIARVDWMFCFGFCRTAPAQRRIGDVDPEPGESRAVMAFPRAKSASLLGKKSQHAPALVGCQSALHLACVRRTSVVETNGRDVRLSSNSIETDSLSCDGHGQGDHTVPSSVLRTEHRHAAVAAQVPTTTPGGECLQ